MKILIAEDDPLTREGLRDILLAEGYEVETAPDGQTALECYRTEKPHMLCLDIMMPHLSGYDVCREIRKNDSQTPIIFISAKSEEIDKVLGLEMERRLYRKALWSQRGRSPYPSSNSPRHSQKNRN